MPDYGTYGNFKDGKFEITPMMPKDPCRSNFMCGSVLYLRVHYVAMPFACVVKHFIIGAYRPHPIQFSYRVRARVHPAAFRIAVEWRK